MTDRLNSDIEAIFGDPAADVDPMDWGRRARLTVELAAALRAASAPSAAIADDVARLAACVDHGLTDEERQAYFRHLASSPAALAEADAMVALLETVESAPLRAPDAVIERARALLAVPAAAPTVPWWRFGWIAPPHVRWGLGSACAAILAVIVIIPMARFGRQPVAMPEFTDFGRPSPGTQFQMVQRLGTDITNAHGVGSQPSGPSAILGMRDNSDVNKDGNTVVAQAHKSNEDENIVVPVPGSNAPDMHIGANGMPIDANVNVPANDAITPIPLPRIPLPSGWAAIAVSPSTHAFGTSTGKRSQRDADEGALAMCAEHGAGDCAVRLSGGQCLAVAARRDGVPAAGVGLHLLEAQGRAFGACYAHPGAGPCDVIASVCGG
jgi:hypothetical protein